MKRAFIQLLSLCVLVAVTSVRSEEDSTALLRDLEKNFSSIQTVLTSFTQKKELKIFSRTLVMDGRLALENPNRLAWRIDSPIRYALVLDGEYARQWDEDSNSVQKNKTAGDPVFEEVIGQIEKWFSGAFTSLLDDYDLLVQSSEPPVLQFTPKSTSMTGKVIRRVTISVRSDRAYVEQIEIEDAGGDKTLIEFYDTVLNAPVSSETWEVVPHE